MKLFKRICLIFVFVLIVLFDVALWSDFLVYKTADIAYLGSAKGIWDSRFYFDPKSCMENDFLYYNLSFTVI